MTKTEIQRQALELPEPERLEIADAIWVSLNDPDSLPLPKWQRDLLEERLAASESEKGLDWQEVRAKLRGSGK
jgi:putative addiction module component (TIGR02574 family)